MVQQLLLVRELHHLAQPNPLMQQKIDEKDASFKQDTSQGRIFTIDWRATGVRAGFAFGVLSAARPARNSILTPELSKHDKQSNMLPIQLESELKPT